MNYITLFYLKDTMLCELE